VNVFGTNITRARRGRDLTIAELAQRAHMYSGWASQIENGTRIPPAGQRRLHAAAKRAAAAVLGGRSTDGRRLADRPVRPGRTGRPPAPGEGSPLTSAFTLTYRLNFQVVQVL
jgi:transcriptional regulator with XRE-family HTH domain